jgi:Domain of unknown function (DUF4184)
MPFTLAHPIAIFPIWRGSSKRLHLPGLILGSMVPDLEYFIALQPSGTFGHTPMGILTQGIPASIGLWLLIYLWLAIPFFVLISLPNSDRWIERHPDGLSIFHELSANFPYNLFDLLNQYIFWRSALNLVISIAIGALTHIFWDSFTHPTGWLVVNLPILQTKIGSLEIYKLLQYGGGIFGLLGLLIWFLVWFEHSKQPVVNPMPLIILYVRDRIIAWRIILSISIAFAIVAVILHAHPEDGLSSIVVRAVVGGISGLFIGFVVYSIGFWTIIRNR